MQPFNPVQIPIAMESLPVQSRSRPARPSRTLSSTLSFRSNSSSTQGERKKRENQVTKRGAADSTIFTIGNHQTPVEVGQNSGKKDNLPFTTEDPPQSGERKNASNSRSGPGEQDNETVKTISPAQTSSSRRDSDTWSESDTIVPRRNLTSFDVAALILNKMVGTGIFTTPGAVVALTQSKPVAIGLWIAGGIFTALFLLIYLEFGCALPFNGGELIYLDEVWPKPELLATVLFSGFFLVLGNSYGNSVAFAKHALLAVDPDVAKSAQLDTRLVRFIAIAVLTVVCFLHYFSSRFGLFLNKLLALFKIILLFTVFVAAIIAREYEDSGRQDFNEYHGDQNAMNGIAAMVLIMYTYQGWENANYVAGEIRNAGGNRAPSRTLKRGAFLAVLLVSVLYVLVTVGYYLACSYAGIIGMDEQSDLGIALYFSPKVFGASRGLKICIALSAFGNLLAVTFTSSKVKQAIALQRILPFYSFFQEDIDTPKGALVLHWVTSVMLIVICPTNADGYSFALGLFTYGHIIVSIFVVLGFYGLAKRMRKTFPYWRPEIINHKLFKLLLPILIVGGNMIILVQSARTNVPGKIPRYWWPVTFFLIIAGSSVYWGVLRILGASFTILKDKEINIGKTIGFEVRVYNETEAVNAPENMQQALVQSRLDGSRRRVAYKFTGAFKSIGVGFNRVQAFIAKYMF